MINNEIEKHCCIKVMILGMCLSYLLGGAIIATAYGVSLYGISTFFGISILGMVVNVVVWNLCWSLRRKLESQKKE